MSNCKFEWRTANRAEFKAARRAMTAAQLMASCSRRRRKSSSNAVSMSGLRLARPLLLTVGAEDHKKKMGGENCMSVFVFIRQTLKSRDRHA